MRQWLKIYSIHLQVYYPPHHVQYSDRTLVNDKSWVTPQNKNNFGVKFNPVQKAKETTGKQPHAEQYTFKPTI